MGDFFCVGLRDSFGSAPKETNAPGPCSSEKNVLEECERLWLRCLGLAVGLSGGPE